MRVLRGADNCHDGREPGQFSENATHPPSHVSSPKNTVTKFDGEFSLYFQLFSSQISRDRNRVGIALNQEGKTLVVLAAGHTHASSRPQPEPVDPPK
ncbi:hypothetical protein SBA4_2880009 [Candidatus Sulfopaludibacter sp. SbA4]|nr:hypothetical protein SBA4_2880009 [Candidatus Sulfopaludibacter sp. SbA4]